jgi:hypothetical protein
MFNYDSTGVNVTGGYTPAPEGVYWLKIVAATEKMSKSGNNMVSCKCEIDEPGEWLGNIVFHNVTFLPKERKGAGMAIQFLKHIGEPWEGEFIVDADAWRGKRFHAKLKIEKDLQGRNRNAVAWLIEEGSDEEVPF